MTGLEEYASDRKLGRLDLIGVHYGADASSLVHGYLDAYEKIFGHLEGTKFTFLQLGLGSSGALMTWRDFFFRASIVGAGTERTQSDFGPRIKTVVVEKYGKDLYDRLANEFAPGIIIDDASHRWDQQISAFQSLFPAVEPGGYYVVEDMQTSFGTYVDRYGKKGTMSAFEQFVGMFSPVVAGITAWPYREVFDSYLRSSVESVTLLRHRLVVKKRFDAPDIHRVRPVRKLVAEFDSTSLDPYRRIDLRIINGSPRIENLGASLEAERVVKMRSADSAVLRNVTVVGGGAMLDSSGSLVSETMNCVNNIGEYRGLMKLPSGTVWYGAPSSDAVIVHDIPGRIPVLLKSAWDANYGHWLFDSLSKLALLSTLELKERPLLVVNRQKGAMRRVVYDTLALAGFMAEDVVEHDFTPRVYSSMLVLGALSEHPIRKAPLAVKYLRSLVDSVAPADFERLYISRNSYGRRKLTNEAELWPILQDRQFIKVIPEQLTFREQVALFKGAKYVVGNTGAAFSNMVFAPKGGTLLALTTPEMPHDFFYDIMCHLGGEYVALQGETDEDYPDMSSSFKISKTMLIQTLEDIGL
ncbi:glycosyltransferase family 61 protein [Actinomyces trachealis]|uniref:glycosyltransferase family 61 protein n=1 Tax=Actinomyces trachealis TaxID=2763540 RepID=UPI0018C51D57|nr:glycosyltransferase 61 family protein [Actinomyces trachealis]